MKWWNEPADKGDWLLGLLFFTVVAVLLILVR